MRNENAKRGATILGLMVGAVVLAGCSTPEPSVVAVRGQMADGSETFAGTARGDLNGPGTLTLVSNAGRNCEGTFVNLSNQTGEGTLNCDDGASGPFRFVASGGQGTGTAVLNGKTLTFRFG